MEPDIPGAIHDLGQIASQLETLLEWEKLAEQEQDSRPLPPFRLSHHNRDDIIDSYSQFLDLRSGIQRIMRDRASLIPEGAADAWYQQMTALDHRMYQLKIMDRFIKP